jgi:hypothetical protein
VLYIYIWEWSLHSHYTTMTQHQGTIKWGPCVNPTLLCLGVVSLLCSVGVLIISHIYIWEMIKTFTMHNTKVHLGGTHTLVPTPMYLGVLPLLCTKSIRITSLYIYSESLENFLSHDSHLSKVPISIEETQIGFFEKK